MSTAIKVDAPHTVIRPWQHRWTLCPQQNPARRASLPLKPGQDHGRQRAYRLMVLLRSHRHSLGFRESELEGAPLRALGTTI